MLKRLSIIVALICALAVAAFAQNSNTSGTTRKRTSTTSTKTTNSSTATDEQSGTPQSEAKPARKTTTQGKRTGSSNEPTVQDVDKTFDALIAGITRADVDAVTSIYWNSPQLVLFNNNGTITKGWQQMHTNRASSYP